MDFSLLDANGGQGGCSPPAGSAQDAPSATSIRTTVHSQPCGLCSNTVRSAPCILELPLPAAADGMPTRTPQLPLPCPAHHHLQLALPRQPTHPPCRLGPCGQAAAPQERRQPGAAELRTGAAPSLPAPACLSRLPMLPASPCPTHRPCRVLSAAREQGQAAATELVALHAQQHFWLLASSPALPGQCPSCAPLASPGWRPCVPVPCQPPTRRFLDAIWHSDHAPPSLSSSPCPVLPFHFRWCLHTGDSRASDSNALPPSLLELQTRQPAWPLLFVMNLTKHISSWGHLGARDGLGREQKENECRIQVLLLCSVQGSQAVKLSDIQARDAWRREPAAVGAFTLGLARCVADCIAAGIAASLTPAASANAAAGRMYRVHSHHPLQHLQAQGGKQPCGMHMSVATSTERC